MEQVIQLSDVSKTYNAKTNAPVHALRGVSLTVNRGDVISVMGPSGSGKSTLLHIIGCLDTATKGSVKVFGDDTALLSAKALAQIRNQKIGFVLQDYGLLYDRSVIENVRVPLLFSKTPWRKMRGIINDALEMLKIGDLSKRNAGELSGGQRQRVACARAIAAGAELILADEPTGALDSLTASGLMDVFFELNSKGTTFIIATHNQQIGERCTRKLALKDGKLYTHID